ncbi:MAG: MCP four helix bundle domain-containing protein, partial [Methanosarcinales archaeon]|nr:MCP four helix bundle domain-containing protein [Methanosarcinales archaeon]
MNIKQKLIAGFFIISLLVGVVGVIGLYANNEVVKSFESGTEHFGSIINAGNEVSSFAKRTQGHTMLYITLHNESDREKALQRIASLREQIAILDARVKDPNARKILSNTITTTDELELIVGSLFAAYDTEMETTGQFKLEDHEELVRELNDAGSSIRRSGLELTNIELELEKEHNIRAKQKASSLYNIIFMISGFAIFSAVAIGLFIYKNISAPISKLRDSAIEIGKGNLKTKIEITSKD